MCKPLREVNPALLELFEGGIGDVTLWDRGRASDWALTLQRLY